jgi:hypothetical protein
VCRKDYSATAVNSRYHCACLSSQPLTRQTLPVLPALAAACETLLTTVPITANPFTPQPTHKHSAVHQTSYASAASRGSTMFCAFISLHITQPCILPPNHHTRTHQTDSASAASRGSTMHCEHKVYTPNNHSTTQPSHAHSPDRLCQCCQPRQQHALC